MEDAHTLVHGRYAATERIGASYESSALLHLQRQLANVMDAILQAQGWDRICDQDQAIGMRPIGDAQGSRMRVHPIGNDAEVDNASRRYLIGGQQADQARITMMKGQHRIEQVRNESGSMANGSLAIAEAGHRVAQRDGNARPHQLIDNVRIAHLLRCQRYYLNAV